MSDDQNTNFDEAAFIKKVTISCGVVGALFGLFTVFGGFDNLREWKTQEVKVYAVCLIALGTLATAAGGVMAVSRNSVATLFAGIVFSLTGMFYFYLLARDVLSDPFEGLPSFPFDRAVNVVTGLVLIGVGFFPNLETIAVLTKGAKDK